MKLETKLEDMPLKEFKVTVWPKPRTYSVMAQTAMQAQGIAHQNYQSDLANTDFYKNEVEELL